MIRLDARELIKHRLDWDALLEQIDAANPRISIVVTGGGSGAIPKCFRRSGASRHFVEAIVPYSRRAVDELLGRELSSPSVSEQTAVWLAEVAHERAQRLDDERSANPVGIALTAALPTLPPRDHQEAIYVAAKSEQGTETWRAELSQGEFDRDDAETVAEAMVFVALQSLALR